MSGRKSTSLTDFAKKRRIKKKSKEENMFFKRFLTWLAQDYESNSWEGQKNSLLAAVAFLAVGGFFGYLSHFIFPKSSALNLILISVVISFIIFVCLLLFVSVKYGTKETNYRIAIAEAEKEIDKKESSIYARFEGQFDIAEELARKTQDPQILNALMKNIKVRIDVQKKRYEFQRELNEKSNQSWLPLEIQKLKMETAVRLTQLRDTIREMDDVLTNLDEEVEDLFKK